MHRNLIFMQTLSTIFKILRILHQQNFLQMHVRCAACIITARVGLQRRPSACSSSSSRTKARDDFSGQTAALALNALDAVDAHWATLEKKNHIFSCSALYAASEIKLLSIR
jgi:hypothetical protein